MRPKVCGKCGVKWLEHTIKKVRGTVEWQCPNRRKS